MYRDLPDRRAYRTFTPWYRRLLGRLADWFSQRPRRPEPPPDFAPPRPPTYIVDDTQTLEFLAPSAGDAFDFEVRILCDWRARGPHAEDSLRTMLGERQRLFAVAGEDEVRHITRQHDAGACADVEKALNDWFKSWKMREEDIPGISTTISRTVRVRVGLDTAVRELRRAAALAGVMRRDEERSSSEQIDHIDGRMRRWQAFLNRLNNDGITQDAIRLALRPQDQAQVLVDQREQQATESKRLRQFAWDVLERLEELGVDETLARFDSAVSALLEHEGIPWPRNGNAPERSRIRENAADGDEL